MARKASSLWTIVSGLIFVSGLLILPGMGYRSAQGPGWLDVLRLRAAAANYFAARNFLS